MNFIIMNVVTGVCILFCILMFLWALVRLLISIRLLGKINKKDLGKRGSVVGGVSLADQVTE